MPEPLKTDLAVWSAAAVLRRGPVCARHLGQPVHAWLVTADGRRLRFHRVAGDAAGRVAVSQLAAGEAVVFPGLIYRAAPAAETLEPAHD